MKPQALAAQTYQTLRRRLVRCEYQPGAVLNEAALADELGVSRTPAREALRQLAADGFITILPKRGIIVSDIKLVDIVQIFQTRQLIEPIALRQSANELPRDEMVVFRDEFAKDDLDPMRSFELDMAMHQSFVEHCGNRFIIEMMRNVFDHNRRAVVFTRQHECRFHDARREHHQIAALVLENKVDEAAQALDAHIESCRRAAVDWYVTQIEHPPVLADRPVSLMAWADASLS